MTAADEDKIDVMYEILYNPNFVPVPSPKVNVKSTNVEGKTSHLMKNHATGTYYDLDELTNLIWNLADGRRTVSQIVEEVQRQRPKVRDKTVLENLLFFADANLLKEKFEQKQKKRFRVVSPFEMDFTLIGSSHNFINSLHNRISPIFKRWLFWATVVFIVTGAALFAPEFVSIYGQKANFEILGSSVLGFFFYYFVALAPVIAIHEIAHAITLVHYGGQAGEMGTGLFYFGPMFYTDTTDAWGLSRKERMNVYLAGNISTLLIGTVLVFIHLFVQIPGFGSHIVLMVAFYCFSMSLMNFAPPFETDGYYILSDAVSMPNLRHDSYGYLGSVIRRIFRRPIKTKTSGFNSRKERIFLLYLLSSAGCIAYMIFQSSIFLFYMGQDVTSALQKVGGALLSSHTLPLVATAIAAASALYFGMQLAGYSLAFSFAVKKAAAHPLRLEAIHDRGLAVFAYLPPQVPESLSNRLRLRMEKVAKKFTSKFEIKQVGRSCLAIMRMGGTNLALVQIKEHLKRIENEFNLAYEKLVVGNKDTIQKSAGIYSPHKIGVTKTLKQFAAESVDAGNSTAIDIIKACEEGQKETLLYLLHSASGTVWTIEVPPAQEYEFEKEMVPSLLLEDMTLTDLYRDTENFKKRTVYGYDSLMVLATETEMGLKDALARPDTYQCLGVLEPIKSRLLLVGRTEQIEKEIEAFAPIFATYTWSGYVDNLLCETCLKLSTIKRVRLPTVEEIEKMSVGELAVLSKDLLMFKEIQALVTERMQKSEEKLIRMNESLTRLKDTVATSENKIAMLDAALRVNQENLAAIPNRTKVFQKDWNTLCKQIERVRFHVQKAYDEMKPTVAKKKRDMLLFSPFMIMSSILLFLLGFYSMQAPWSVAFFSVAGVLQIVYWALLYRARSSLHKVTKYSSQPFNAVHTVLLSLSEAVFGYISTEDVLASTELLSKTYQNRQDHG